MMGVLIGVAFLAVSWLWGIELFSPVRWTLWAGSILAGLVLIAWSAPPVLPWSRWTRMRRGPLFASLGGLLLFAALAPWPYRVAALLLGFGLALTLVASRPRWVVRISEAAVLSGLVLFFQAVVMFCYTSWTARSHELPAPLPQLLAAMARFVRIHAATDGSNVVLPTMRANHALGATWELLLDPASLALLAGALVLLVLTFRASMPSNAAPARSAKQPREIGSRIVRRCTAREHAISRGSVLAMPLVRRAALLVLAAVAWLPVRAGLLMAVFLHRAIRTDYDSPLNLMNQFWSPWVYLLLALPLALLLARCLQPRSQEIYSPEELTSPRTPPARMALAPAAAFGVVGLATLAACWDPVGARQGGRMAFDEYHSKWEPTTRPFDTEWYGHLSGYNYACIYDYASRFYDVGRITNAITEATLANLDVLILKVPTEPFAGSEIDSILRFVFNGGSLLLVGEHTDVFNTGYHLNSVARRLGFSFRYDCLFGMKSFFDQFYKPFLVSHPAVQAIRGLDFATSCSIAPGRSRGRGVIIAGGLKNSMADYHANNYYPQAEDHAAMRYGAFVQLWGTRHGKGRVLAFTDSTIFSNFSAFEPGKPELLLGMLEWLNHRDRLGSPRFLLLCLALAVAIVGILVARRYPAPLLLIVAAGALGWLATTRALALSYEKKMPLPKAVRPYTKVVIDRTVCDGPLSKNGFITGSTNGFGIFERWILRLGYFTERASGVEALTGDAAAFFYPTKPIDKGHQQRLLDYVENGGKLLIIDGPANSTSTAAGLLQPFGLSFKATPIQSGLLSTPLGWPAVPVEQAHEVSGGTPFIQLEGKPVASYVRRGKGTVVVVGFGSRFCDANMGVTGDVEPNEDLRRVFDLQFTLMRAIIGNTLP